MNRPFRDGLVNALHQVKRVAQGDNDLLVMSQIVVR